MELDLCDDSEEYDPLSKWDEFWQKYESLPKKEVVDLFFEVVEEFRTGEMGIRGTEGFLDTGYTSPETKIDILKNRINLKIVYYRLRERIRRIPTEEEAEAKIKQILEHDDAKHGDIHQYLSAILDEDRERFCGIKRMPMDEFYDLFYELVSDTLKSS